MIFLKKFISVIATIKCCKKTSEKIYYGELTELSNMYYYI